MTSSDFTFKQEVARQDNPAFVPRPIDQGAVRTFYDSARHAFNQSFGTGVQRNAMTVYADHLDQKYGLQPLDEDTFNEHYSLDGTLKYQEGIRPTRARLEAEWKMRELWDETLLDSSRDHWISQFAGGVVGSVAHPIDLATMFFTPGIGAAAKGGKLTFAAGKLQNTRALSRMVLQGATAGAIDGAWQAPAMLALNQRIQQNYSEADAMVDFMASPIFGGFLGGMSFAARKAVGAIDFQETLMGQDKAMVATVIAADEGNARRLSALRRLEELNEKGEDMTPRELAEMRQLYENEWTSGMAMPKVVTGRFDKYETTINARNFKEARAQSRLPKTENENNISALMGSLFGVDVQFIPFKSTLGMVYGRDGGTIFLSENIGDAPDMMLTAGHEFAHSLRLREPDTFKQIVDHIASEPELTSLFNEAMQDISRFYGSHDWNALSPNRKLDEGLAQMVGRTFQQKQFWKSLERNKSLGQKITAFIRHMFTAVQDMLQKAPQDPNLQKFATDLAGILTTADQHGFDTDPSWFSSPTGAQNKATRIFSKLVAAREKLADFDPRKIERRRIDKLARMDEGSEFWFGVPLNDWIEKSIIKLTHVKEGVDIIDNPYGYNKETKGIPVFYYKGKKLRWNSETKKLMVDKIEVYNATNPKLAFDDTFGKIEDLRGIDEETTVAGDEEFTGDLGAILRRDSVELEAMIKADDFIVKNEGNPFADIDPTQSFDQQIISYIDGHTRGGWMQAAHEKTAVEYGKDRHAVNREKFIMKKQLEELVGPIIRFDIDGETHELNVKDLSDSQLYAAWTSVGHDVALSAGLEPLVIYPFDAVRDRKGVSLEALQAVGFDTQPPAGMNDSMMRRINQILGGPDTKRADKVRRMIETMKLMEQLPGRLADDRRAGNDEFFGLLPSEYVQALKNLDEDLNSPKDLWDELALPRPEEFDAKFNEYRERIKDKMQNIRKNRQGKVMSDALQAEKVMMDRANAERVSKDVEARNIIENELNEDIPELLRLDDSDARGAEAQAAKKEARQEIIDRMSKKDFEIYIAIRANHKRFREVADSIANLEELVPEALETLSMPDALKDDLRPIVRRPGTARKEVYEVIKEHSDNTLFNIVNDHLIHETLVNQAKASRNPLKWISTYLDGLYRDNKDFTFEDTKGSVEYDMKAKVTEDVSTLINILDAENLLDEFHNDNIMDDVIKWLETDGAHEVPAPIARVARHIQNTYKSQVADMNTAGARVKWLKGFALSQIWDINKVKNVPFNEFRDTIVPHLDWDKTTLHHRNRLTDPDSYLRDVYDDMVSGHYRELHTVDTEGFGGNLANQVSHHRSLYLREGGTFPVMAKFGRGDSISSMVLNQLRKNSERVVLLERFGSNYKSMFERVMANTKAKSPPKNAKVVGKLKHSLDYQITQGVFRKLTGEMDTPLYSNISDMGMLARRYSNLVFLWQSGISAISDVPSIVANLKYNGVDLGVTDKEFWSAVKRGYKARNNKTTRLWLQANGAAIQSVLNNLSVRTGLGESSPVAGKIGEWNNWMFNHNGLGLITDVGQATFLDIMSGHLGSGELSADTFRSLSRHGITPDELMEARKNYAQKVEGYDDVKLSPDMVELHNPDLARRLRSFFEDNMRQAVIEPGAREQVIARGGLKAGTIPGEAMRIASQYTTFPLAIQMKTFGRLMNGYGEREFAGMMSSSQGRAAVHALSFAASGFVLGYMITVIKDILKGREPIHLRNMNTENFQRIVETAGIAGIVGPLFQLELPVGPMAREAVDAAAEVAEGDMSAYKAFTTTQGFLPGATIPLVGPGQDSMRALFSLMVGDAFGMNYENNFQNRLRSIENRFEQSSIFEE